MMHEGSAESDALNYLSEHPRHRPSDKMPRRDFLRHMRDAAIGFGIASMLGQPEAEASERLVVVEKALRLARAQIGKPFSANAHGDPLPSNPPKSFVCTSLVMWSYYKASGGSWTDWRPSDTILDLNGLSGRPALVRFFSFEDEADLNPGDILYRSPHARHVSGSHPRDYYDEAGEPGFNEADPRHDYHHAALYAGNGQVIQAGGDRRGDIIIAGPRSYSVRVTRFDTAQWAPDAGRPRRLKGLSFGAESDPKLRF